MKSSPMKYIWILFVIAFIGCTTVEKAKKKLDENPVEAGRYCAEKFPVKDTVVFTEDSIHFDTIYVDQGEVPLIDTASKNDTIVITKTITLPGKVITKTVEHEKIVQKENTARVEALRQELANSNAQLSQSKTRVSDMTALRNGWRLKALITWLIFILLLIGWILTRKIIR